MTVLRARGIQALSRKRVETLHMPTLRDSLSQRTYADAKFTLEKTCCVAPRLELKVVDRLESALESQTT